MDSAYLVNISIQFASIDIHYGSISLSGLNDVYNDIDRLMDVYG